MIYMYYRFLLPVMIWILCLPECKCYCMKKELEAYTSGSLTYRSYGYAYGGYDKNMVCEALFTASYPKDVIKIEVIDTDMQERYFGQCVDKVTIFDGPTRYSPILETFCGRETPVVESTANSVLLVFETDDSDAREYKGFKLEYSSLDRGGFDAYMDSSSMGAGTIVAITIPVILIYAIIAFFIYKRCKYNQQLRRNLAASGHTPEDLRVAMATMLDQGRQGRLNIPRSGPEGVQESLFNIMDQNAANRNNSNQGGRGRSGRGRVRHPAGDVQTHASRNPNHHISASAPDGDSSMSFMGDGDMDQRNGYNPHLSNNNITTNNNTAANLNYQAYPGYPSDLSGVYYAGNVDESGMLHPPHGGAPYYPPSGALPPTILVNNPHLDIEDDRRSRSSGRSGRNSPRHSPSHSHSGHHSRTNSNSTGHHSHRHARSQQGSHRSLNNLEQDGSMLTYYGMVDGEGRHGNDAQSRQEGAYVSESDIDVRENFGAPPSYEEAATGKYSPYHHDNS